MKTFIMVWTAKANPFAIIVLFLIGSTARADELSQLRAGIEDRVARFSTVDVTWTITTRFEKASTKGGSRDPFVATGTDQNLDGKLPATIAWQARLRCDGPKLRVDYARPTWDVQKGRFTAPRKVMVYDGSTEKFFMTSEEDPFPHSGAISGPPLQWGRSMDFAPLLWHFRAFAYPGMLGQRFFLATVELSKETVDRQSCIVIKRTRGIGNSARHEVLWVDAEPGHSIRRFAQFQNDRIQREVRVDRLQVLDGCVVPLLWSVEERNVEGRFDVASNAKIVTAIVNQPIEDAVFRLTFPPGSIVQDQRGHERRFIMIGNGQRELEVTRRQLADALSAQQLLRMLEDR